MEEADGLPVGAAGTPLGSAARSSLVLLLQNPHRGPMPLFLPPAPFPAPLYSGSKQDRGAGRLGTPHTAEVCWPHNLYPSLLPTNVKKCSSDHHVGLLQTYGLIQMTYCRFRNASLAARLRPGTLGRPSSLLWAVIFHYQEVEKSMFAPL